MPGGATAGRRALLAAGLCALLLGPSVAAARGGVPSIALIIDDLGYGLEEGRAALALPGALTYSILPHTPYGRHLSRRCRALGKQVMVHLPMETVAGAELDQGALRLHMSRAEFRASVEAALAAVPEAVGVNNHMGSLLTRHPGAMRWLMEDMSDLRGGLFFVDSRTTRKSVAERAAREAQLPAARRDVFLDNRRDTDHIRSQLHRLEGMARERGTALGIAHPYPETLRVLAEELPALRERGVRLVRVSELIDIQTRSNSKWHASSSPSLRVAKSSKQ